MLHFALEQERALPLVRGEGPHSLVLCPSRELARQTHAILTDFAAALATAREPELRVLLAVGGVDLRDQVTAESLC